MFEGAGNFVIECDFVEIKFQFAPCEFSGQNSYCMFELPALNL